MINPKIELNKPLFMALEFIRLYVSHGLHIDIDEFLAI